MEMKKTKMERRAMSEQVDVLHIVYSCIYASLEAVAFRHVNKLTVSSFITVRRKAVEPRELWISSVSISQLRYTHAPILTACNPKCIIPSGMIRLEQSPKLSTSPLCHLP